MEGFCSGFSEDNPALMSELRALRNRKHELESHLTSLQDSRRQLMDQLEGLMKLLKVNNLYNVPIHCGVVKRALCLPPSPISLSWLHLCLYIIHSF